MPQDLPLPKVGGLGGVVLPAGDGDGLLALAPATSASSKWNSSSKIIGPPDDPDDEVLVPPTVVHLLPGGGPGGDDLVLVPDPDALGTGSAGCSRPPPVAAV